uniref:Uncharacterized protein n=1 Tax=Anguilla anguilla TaxID=7936 RepID=A0A0E9T957_ANGAN
MGFCQNSLHTEIKTVIIGSIPFIPSTSTDVICSGNIKTIAKRSLKQNKK